MSAPDDDDPGSPSKALVGYRQPPAQHQFRKGASGNPRGRPRKKAKPGKTASRASGLEDLIMQEAYRPIQIRENGKLEELPMIQAVLRSLGVAAVKGSHRAQLAVTGLVQAVEQRSLSERHAMMEAAIEYKKGWEEVFEACDRRGETRPNPIPHPDDILVDIRAGQVIFNGPMDDHHKAHWDKLAARRAESLLEIEACRQEIEEHPELREVYEIDIAHEQRLADMIGRLIPDEPTRRAPGFNIGEWRQEQAKTHERRERLRQLRIESSR